MLGVKRIVSKQQVRRMAWNMEGMFRLLTLLRYKDKDLLHHTIRAHPTLQPTIYTHGRHP